jgi:hypothetical protein
LDIRQVRRAGAEGIGRVEEGSSADPAIRPYPRPVDFSYDRCQFRFRRGKCLAPLLPTSRWAGQFAMGDQMAKTRFGYLAFESSP